MTVSVDNCSLEDIKVNHVMVVKFLLSVHCTRKWAHYTIYVCNSKQLYTLSNQFSCSSQIY